MSSSPISYPPTIPYTEIDDFRFVGPIRLDSLTPRTVFAVDEFCVGAIAYICNLVLMAPAFLVRHASIASSLYKLIKELETNPPPPHPRYSAENVEFEKKLYMYARRIISVLVPGVKNNNNTSPAPTPAEFIAEFAALVKRIKRREKYVWRRHSRRVTASDELAQANDLLIATNSAFARVYALCRDPSAIDKAAAAVKDYAKFAMLHLHILGLWSLEDQLTVMIEDYWALIHYMKDKKISKAASDRLIALVAAAQLSRNIVRARIPPPPPEPPVLERGDAYDSDGFSDEGPGGW